MEVIAQFLVSQLFALSALYGLYRLNEGRTRQR